MDYLKPTKPRVFQERTNSSNQMLPTKDLEIIYEQYPTMPVATTFVHFSAQHFEPFNDFPVTPPKALKQRPEATRAKRHSQAEQDLARSLQSCSKEPSQHQLQISALRSAAAILLEHAEDAKQTLESLRSLLTNRDVEPHVYRSMQRERWRVERRQRVVEDLLKVLQQHLVSPKPLTLDRSHPLIMEKCDGNLAEFLQSNICRKYTFSRRRHRPPLPKSKKTSPNERPDVLSVHKHSRTLPLLLSTSPMQPPWILRSPKPLTSLSSSHLPYQSPWSSNVAIKDLTIPTTTPSRAPLLIRDTNGTATIWRPPSRPESEIVPDIPVDLPDYAVQLLADFETNSRAGRKSLDVHDLTLSKPQLTTSRLYPPSSSAKDFQSKRAVFSTPPPAPRLVKKASIKTRHITDPPPKSPSRKRISALFSLENISYKLNSGIDAVRTKRFSVPPVTQDSTTTMPAVYEDEGDRPRESWRNSTVGGASLVLGSSRLPSPPTTTTAGVNGKSEETKPMDKIRKRISALGLKRN